MPSITIQGHKFEVPDAVIGRFSVGYVLSEEGEANALRQTLLENLRNNFAGKVKTALGDGETLSDEAVASLQTDFNGYAADYKFGVRAVGTGGGGQRLDPITREMHKLAREDFTRAYNAKFAAKPDKELVAERVPELVDKKHDEYLKRAKAILRQRESVATDTLESIGL